MSVKVMGIVWDHFPEGGSLLMTMIALADHADHDGGSIFPSNAQLARKTRQSERTVQYQRRRIEEMGWLVAVANEQGGRGKATEYRIPIEDLAPRFQGSAQQGRAEIKGAEVAPFSDAEKGAKGAGVAPFIGAEKGAKGATAVAPQRQKNKQPPYSPPKGDDLLAVNHDAVRRWFEAEFWPEYPKRVGKAEALAELVKISPDAATLEAIIAGLNHRKRAQQFAQARNVFFAAWPDAHRWLRKRRWEDRDPVPHETSPSGDRRCRVCGKASTMADAKGFYCSEHDPDLGLST